LERLEDELRRLLPASPQEKKLLGNFEELERLKRLAKLELSRKDWQQVTSIVHSPQTRDKNKILSAMDYA
jgi:hypothetical protein